MGRHHRGAAGHRFDGRKAKAFIARRHDDQGGTAVALYQFIRGESTGDAESFRDASSAGPGKHGVLWVVVVDEGEGHVFREFGEGFDQGSDALVRVVGSADAQDFPGVAWNVRVRGVEISVESIPDVGHAMGRHSEILADPPGAGLGGCEHAVEPPCYERLHSDRVELHGSDRFAENRCRE